MFSPRRTGELVRRDQLKVELERARNVVINSCAEPMDGHGWPSPPRSGSVLLTNDGVDLPADFVTENELSDYRHVRAYFCQLRTRSEFWFQFLRNPQPNTLVMLPKNRGTGGLLVYAPGLLAGDMSRHAGAHQCNLKAHTHGIIFVITLMGRL